MYRKFKHKKGLNETELNNLLSNSDYFASHCFLNSNKLRQDNFRRYEMLIGLGVVDELKIQEEGSEPILKISEFLKKHTKAWKFVYLSYDLKNTFEKLSSTNEDILNFRDVYIFIPKFIFIKSAEKEELLYHHSLNSNDINEFLNLLTSATTNQAKNKNPNFKARIDKATYLKQIEKIQQNIKEGNIYEMNFCQEFYSKNSEIVPNEVYKELNNSSPAPFAAFFKEGCRYLMSASPERYIQKYKGTLISQPIKGTSRRENDAGRDKLIKQQLETDIKERAENIMIVDLVRNDFSRINESSHINVEELCGIYSFAHVHQMISTISATVPDKISFIEILKTIFPMGSMTGAPKLMAMQLIDEFETSRRALFSGSVGYISPQNDFDFNVIIRSLLYNKEKKYLSLSTGGAITYLSDPLKEYEETLLKAEAILKIFDKSE